MCWNTRKEADKWDMCLVIFCVTAPYAEGEDCPGIDFKLKYRTESQQDWTLLTKGCITAYTKNTARMPITLIKPIQVTKERQVVGVYWESIRRSTCYIDMQCDVTLISMVMQGVWWPQT